MLGTSEKNLIPSKHFVTESIVDLILILKVGSITDAFFIYSPTFYSRSLWQDCQKCLRCHRENTRVEVLSFTYRSWNIHVYIYVIFIFCLWFCCQCFDFVLMYRKKGCRKRVNYWPKAIFSSLFSSIIFGGGETNLNQQVGKIMVQKNDQKQQQKTQIVPKS